MSKIIAYRGNIPIGTQDRIKLTTNDGKRGYKIVKFEIISQTPGNVNSELLCKILSTAQTGNITEIVNFTDHDLLAVAFSKSVSNDGLGADSKTIIFDNRKFNQDIFVSVTDAVGSTVPCNYYIELETMSISDLESTMMTLQNLRSITT